LIRLDFSGKAKAWNLSNGLGEGHELRSKLENEQGFRCQSSRIVS
jgi:hypothetical protein